MVSFPTQTPNCDTINPALLDLFLSSDGSVCSAMPFPPLGNSDHLAISVPIDFLSNSKWDALFHRIAYYYSPPDWDGLRNHLRDNGKISLSSVLLLLLVNSVDGVRLKLMYISLIVSIRSNFIHLHGFQLVVLLP